MFMKQTTKVSKKVDPVEFWTPEEMATIQSGWHLTELFIVVLATLAIFFLGYLVGKYS